MADVTLYGVADLGYGSVKVKDATGATVKSVTQFGATSATSTATGMTSGNLSGSRWGIKGSEDLGGGLSAAFAYESAISANDGTSTGFTRASNLSLKGGFGTVGFGLQYTPSFSAVGGTDIDGTSAYSTSNLYPTGVRGANAIMYTSPSFGGVTAKLMVANQKSGANSETNSTLTDASVTYSAAPLTVVAAFGSSKSKSPAVAYVAPTNTKAATLEVAAADGKKTSSVIGASYDLGSAVVMFNTVSLKGTNNLDATKSYKVTETNLGVKVPMGAVSLVAGWGKNKVTMNGAASVSNSDYLLGANYALSKRTDAYVRMSKTGAISTTTAKAKVSKTTVGLRHTF